MFTIKWIVRTPYGEVVRMFEARDVIAAFRNLAALRSDPKEPKERAPTQHLNHWAVAGRPVDTQLFIMDPYEPNFAGRSLDCGTVYIMNDHGATVCKYVLNDEMVDNPQPLHFPVETSVGL